MTEEQAREKWCPEVRLSPVATTERYTVETTRDTMRIGGCIASDCMMWRWNTWGATIDGKWDERYPTEGYCGLGVTK